jgi:pyruvate kinase
VTVHTMAHIADVTEEYLVQGDNSLQAVPLVRTTLPAGALARGALRIVHDLKAKLVVVWTQTGTTARVFSKHHFPVPIIALSPDHRSLRRMALHYGVIPQEMQATADLTSLIARIDEFVLSRNYAEPNDRILIVAGWSPGTPGTMNGLVIHTVGESWTPVPNAQMLRQMVKSEK